MGEMQRVDEMTSPPVIGERYLVPCVKYPFANDRLQYWPVIGIQHDDKEHLNFPYQHYHLDWRFVPKWAFDWAMRRMGNQQRIYGLPLCFTDPASEQWAPLPFPTPELRIRTCRRLIPGPSIFQTVREGIALHRAYSGRDAVRGPHGFICPHRATPLGSVTPDADGTVLCPAHGLRFCAKTGKSIPTVRPEIANT